MKNFKIFTGALFLFFFIFLPKVSFGAEIVPDQITITKAKVLSTASLGTKTLPGLSIPSTTQSLTAEILEGDKKGEHVVFTNDEIQLKKGDIFYLNNTILSDDGSQVLFVQDAYRMPVIYFLAILFVLLVLIIGGKQGLRGLLSLIGGLILILFVLLPGILHGYSPVFVSIAVASLIIIVGSYVTHGFNRTTSSAVIGMIITVIITGIMAYLSVHMAQLSGYSNDEAMYLNMNFRGNIDLVGIVIGGIMIGLLGVLYDVAIGQAISVEELHTIAPHISRIVIFKRALRIGREHIGALVNTLAIAYVGASLPLLLLFATPPVDIMMTMNKEIFATEIIRILIGSIGLVLAVPITTLLATFILVKIKKSEDSKTLEVEKEALEHFEHHH